MAFSPKIENLRQWAVWESNGMPVNLLLAIITHESGGIIGRPSRDTTKAFDVKNDEGKPEKINRAFGLMQTTSGLLQTWQEQNRIPQITIDDLRKTDERAARLQIHLGSWYLKNCLRQLAQYDPTFDNVSNPTDDQWKFVLCAYAKGFGAQSPPDGPGLKPKLDGLKQAGKPLTWTALKSLFPSFQPIGYAERVFSNFSSAGGASLEVVKKPLMNQKYLPFVIIGGVLVAWKLGLFKRFLNAR